MILHNQCVFCQVYGITRMVTIPSKIKYNLVVNEMKSLNIFICFWLHTWPINRNMMIFLFFQFWQLKIPKNQFISQLKIFDFNFFWNFINLKNACFLNLNNQVFFFFFTPPSISWWKKLLIFSNKVAKLVEFKIEKKDISKKYYSKKPHCQQ